MKSLLHSSCSAVLRSEFAAVREQLTCNTLFLILPFFHRETISNRELEEEVKFQKSTGALTSDKDRELETLRNEVLTHDFHSVFWFLGKSPLSCMSDWSVCSVAADRSSSRWKRHGQDPPVGRRDVGERQSSAAESCVQSRAKAHGKADLWGRRQRGPTLRWGANDWSIRDLLCGGDACFRPVFWFMVCFCRRCGSRAAEGREGVRRGTGETLTMLPKTFSMLLSNQHGPVSQLSSVPTWRWPVS